MTKEGRLPCIVPHCRRTRKDDGKFTDWICARHWSGVPMLQRALYRRTCRRVRRIIARRPQYREYWHLRPGSPERLRAVAMWRRLEHVWSECKRTAIERAMGI